MLVLLTEMWETSIRDKRDLNFQQSNNIRLLLFTAMVSYTTASMWCRFQLCSRRRGFLSMFLRRIYNRIFDLMNFTDNQYVNYYTMLYHAPFWDFLIAHFTPFWDFWANYFEKKIVKKKYRDNMPLHFFNLLQFKTMYSVFLA